jgi:hypothetical protein
MRIRNAAETETDGHVRRTGGGYWNCYKTLYEIRLFVWENRAFKYIS